MRETLESVSGACVFAETGVDATAAGLVAANADGTPAIVPAPADVPVSDGVSSLLGADPALGTSP